MEQDIAIQTVEERKGTYDMDTSEFYDALDVVLKVAKERQTSEADVRLNNLLSAIALREDKFEKMLNGDPITLDRRDYYRACVLELGWVKSELGL